MNLTEEEGILQKRNMEANMRNSIRSAVMIVAGGVLATLVFIMTSIWVTDAADRGAEESANSVSEFYIEELTHQKVQGILGEIRRNYNYIENALSEITESDLESKASLRRYLKKIRNLYGIDTFSFVDENNILYTGISTSTISEQYLFIQGNGIDPTLTTTNVYGSKKQVILSVPVRGVKFGDARIKTCFVKIDMDRIVDSTTLHSDGTKTYCGLYHKTGENLTNLPLGRIQSGKNILSFVGDSRIQDGRTFRDVAQDFGSKHFGSVHAESDGEDVFLYYVPIYGTDWMLAVLSYDNVISDHITKATNSLMIRNRIQMSIMTLTLLFVFVSLFVTGMRNSKARVEREKKVSEKIREAYVKLNRKSEAMNIIHGVLNSGPWSMEFDRNGNITSCYWSDIFRKMLGYTDENDFPNKLESWTNLIHEDDKERVVKDYWAAVHDYTGKTIYDSKYRMLTKDRGWRWFHDSGSLTRRSDGSPVSYVGLFIDIDEKKKTESALKEQLFTFEALGRDYKNIFRLDPSNKTAEILKLNGFIPEAIRKSRRRLLPYEEIMNSYIRDRVYKEDAEFLSKAMSLPTVMRNLEKQNEYSKSYRAVDNGEIHFYQFKFMSLEDGMVIVAFSNVDGVVQAAKEREMLKTLSETDLMTGLLNRGSGESKVTEALGTGSGGLFCLLDVDNFKNFNDNFGHDVGDKVIVAVAKKLRGAFRESDIVFRLGGDEFAAFAPSITSESEAEKALERFKGALEETEIEELGGTRITVSIGATIVESGKGASFTATYKLVDTAVYESKKTEGTTVTFKS